MDSDKYPIHKYIYEWLLDHESIIVPDLGQFVAEFKGASIHPSIHSVSPPNKTIVFNSEPKHDDGALTGFISQKENLSETEASDYIKQFVTELKIALASDQKYELPAFGTFVKNPEGEIEFTADEAINFEGDSFGLPKLFYKPVEKKEDVSFFDQIDTSDSTEDESTVEKASEVNSAIEEKVESTGYTTGLSTTSLDDDDDDDEFDDEFDDDDEPKRRKWVVPVVAILLIGIVLTAGVIYLPKLFSGGKAKTSKKEDSTQTVAGNNKGDTNTTTSTEVSLADSGKTAKTSSADEQHKTDKDPKTSSSKSDKPEVAAKTTTNTTKPSDNNQTQSSRTTTPTYTPPVVANATGSIVNSFPFRPQAPGSAALVTSPTSRYYIIVGSFDQQANANSLYNNLKARGFNAKIIPPNGEDVKHRVASGSYATKAEASRGLYQLKGRFGNQAWIKRF